MRYVQLRAFHHVAICGGFSRAAEMLHLTQPAISDQVRKLEEEYDILLFDRSKKQVVLTPAGEDLLEITRRLFDMENQALDLLSESRALRTGHLRVIADAAHHVLPIISAFRARYPAIRISFMAGNTETVISALRSYEADIGVIGEMPLGRDYEVLRLNSTPILAMVPKGHPLAEQGSASLKVLAGHPLVLRERGSKTRAKLEEEALRQGIALEAAIEAEGREAVREIVAAGAGIGFVSAAEFGHDARLSAVTIDDAGLFMDEALICLRERSSAKLVQAFFTLARSL